MLPAEPCHIGLTFDDATALRDGHSVYNYMSVAYESNQNLTRAQKELLLWHWKLGHANLQWIQTLCCEPTNNNHRFVLEQREQQQEQQQQESIVRGGTRRGTWY